MKRKGSRFKNREEAGLLLSRKLRKYKNREVVIYAIPRGGVVTASIIAKNLNAPLDLIITRKIGHPRNPEYAVSAVSENGYLIKTNELESINPNWIKEEVKRQQQEITRRKKTYLKGKNKVHAKGKIAILVDDGIATGLTTRAAIEELKHKEPNKIVVATPVISKSTKELIEKEADEIVALKIISNEEFSCIGSFYENFSQVSDKEVIKLSRGERT